MERDGQILRFTPAEVTNGGVPVAAPVNEAPALFDTLSDRRKQLLDEAQALGMSPLFVHKSMSIEALKAFSALSITIAQLQPVVVEVESQQIDNDLQDLQDSL